MTDGRWQTSTRRIDVRRYQCALDSYPRRHCRPPRRRDRRVRRRGQASR